MSRITKSAKLRSCTVRLCGCKNERETVVLAHAPSVYKGTGIKSPDWWGVYACHYCHTILDGDETGEHDSDWLRAIFETQEIHHKEGRLKEL